MIIKKAIILVMAALLMGLSSCSKKVPDPFSETVIRQEIIEQFNIDETTIKLNALTVKYRVIKDLHSTVNVKVVLENADAVSTLDVFLYFTYSSNKWTFVSKTVNFVSAVTKTQPVLADVLQALKDIESVSGYQRAVYGLAFRENGSPVNTKTEPFPQSGWILYTFETRSSILDTTAIGTTVIKASYIYDQGWKYSLDSWIYTETSTLTGDYIFTFGEKPYYFNSGQIVSVHLEGAMTLIAKNDLTFDYDNTISGTMMTEGETFTLSAQPNNQNGLMGPTSTSIWLNFGSDDAAYLILNLDDGTGHGGDPSQPKWFGYYADNQYISILRVK